jgi:hypothetical protein
VQREKEAAIGQQRFRFTLHSPRAPIDVETIPSTTTTTLTHG